MSALFRGDGEATHLCKCTCFVRANETDGTERFDCGERFTQDFVFFHRASSDG